MADQTRAEFITTLRAAIEQGMAIAAEGGMTADFKFRADGLAIVVTGASKQGAESVIHSIAWSQLESDEEFTLAAVIAGAVREASTRVEGILRGVR